MSSATSPESCGAAIPLADGRQLGVLDAGDPAGAPVFYFHGLGASRRSAHPDGAIAAALGVRVVALDRPGIGLSTPKPGRTLLDWPDDVAAAADALGIDRFAILGWSGGAAHALACAHRLPARVTAVALASGVAPLAGVGGAPDYLSARWRSVVRFSGVAPWFLRLLLLAQARGVRRAPGRFLDILARAFPPTDRALLADPALRPAILASMHDVYAYGVQGVYDDGWVLARPWGFRPEDVTTPAHLWHGDADTVLHVAFGRYMARALPDCRATFCPGEGHFLYLRHWDEMLAALREGR
jgi:pimeloyl-ACP methyl ester carboxylesterase